jgi:hypothetical protein
LCATGLIRKRVQTYFENKKTLGLVSADDSLSVFAEYVESISEEAPVCIATASGDQEESDASVEESEVGLALSEESSEESDGFLDEPEPQPLSPQHLHCRKGTFSEHFTEPSLYGQAILAAAGEGHERNVRHCTRFEVEGSANCGEHTLDDAFARELEQALDEDPLFEGFPSPESHEAVLHGALGNSFDV